LAFLERHAGWGLAAAPELAAAMPSLATFVSQGGAGLLMTPARSFTDGFFFSMLTAAA
jgi:16S rRNA (cytosine967-C5)-methyltransferase